VHIPYFVEGYILGLSVATTIGVSGVLCLQNMATGRVAVGLSAALASSLADVVCGMLVVFGLTQAQGFLMHYESLLAIIAGLLLCSFGIRTIFSKISLDSGHGESRAALHAFVTVFFLAIVDPVSVLDFMALCLGLTLDFSLPKNAMGFLSGLFFGSATWWFSLCGLLLYFRQRISVYMLQVTQYIVGAGIFAFGINTLLAA
jgi:threonine/homoserine/homoserine lactone efflux protein